MKIEDVLDDLVGRFLLQLKYPDRRTPERVIFHIEEAHWFYEDYYRRKFKLPYINLRDFTIQIVQHAKLATNIEEVDQEFRKFIKYKKTVPVFGGLIFNSFLDKILLVRGYGGKNSFTFPRGKINKSETPVECAVREVMEEVGYNIQHKMLKSVYVDMSTKAKESKLYVVLNVPERTQFVTQTRNEIKEIKWASLASISRGKEEAFSYVRLYYKDIKKAIDLISAVKKPLNRIRIMEAMEASIAKEQPLKQKAPAVKEPLKQQAPTVKEQPLKQQQTTSTTKGSSKHQTPTTKGHLKSQNIPMHRVSSAHQETTNCEEATRE